MLRQIFKEVKQSRGITGKAISQATGISEVHISAYLRGKRDVTSETLWRMIEAMDELSKGAAAEFRDRLPGEGQINAPSNHPVIFYQDLEADELAEEVIKLGKALKGALHENPQLRTATRRRSLPLSAVGS
jgi:transcriptional regulator with XRE-family HTH domain